MQLLRRILPPNHDLIVWGDTHYGSMACSVGTVKEIVAEVNRKKNTFTVHLGDAIEAKLVDSPHFSNEIHDAKKTPIVQMNEWCDLVRDIPARKWLGLTRGNHEHKHLRFGDLTAMACDNLGIPFCGFTAKHIIISEKTGLPMYKMLTTHGNKVANSTAPDPIVRRKNMESQIKRSLAVLGHADCALNFAGHGHKLIVVKPVQEPYLMDSEGQITGHYTVANHSEGWIDESLRYYGMCGTQHRSFVINGTTYSEVGGYGPATMGYIKVEVRDGKINDVRECHLGHV